MEVLVGQQRLALNGIKGVLLDLDNTLYPYTPVHQKALEVCAVHSGISSEHFHALYSKHRSNINSELKGTASSHNRQLYFQRMSEELFNKLNIDWSLRMYDCYWNASLKEMTLFSWVKQFLETLKRQMIRITILTDLTVRIQLKKIMQLGIEDYIDFVVSSEEAGVEKPDAKVFLLGMQKINCKHDEVVIIGNSYAKDIVGARNLGIKSVLVTVE